MTINDICQHYQVAPSQVHAWKKVLLEQGSELFEKSSKRGKQNDAVANERVQSQLYEKIGQLTVERDFLKKGLNKLHWNNDEV
jgi:transposase